MIKTIFFSANPDKIPAQGYWDQALLVDILSMSIFKNMEAPDGAVVVIPAPYQGEYIKEINTELSKYKWVLLFLTSDEEGKFPVEKIKHPNIKIWVQYPKQGKHDKYGKLPLGYTTETRKNLLLTEKTLDVFYSGQNTHARREMCYKALEPLRKEVKYMFVENTKGFSQGQKPNEYMANMSNAKAAPAPSGPVSADSFRAYEALEAGAVPIADNISLAGDADYFHYLFGDVPFPTLNAYADLPGYILDVLENYPVINNRVQAWWIKKKWDLAWQFFKDIESLTEFAPGAPINRHNQTITTIIPVSPIKSHPSTEILEKTIESVRYHLPDSENIITFDGVREEQEDMRNDYEEFIRRALFLCNTKWDAIPIIFNEHTHQVGMARVALEEVKTPLILYMEQDTPLVMDLPIDWNKLSLEILLEKANVIRFHFEARIPDEHKHLMLGEPENELLKTAQWSQRPHLASTSFYKYILRKNFSDEARCFIEDKLHGVLQQDFSEMGTRGWDLWKLFIYYPDPKNIKRSLNNDGRAGGKKYDDTQIF